MMDIEEMKAVIRSAKPGQWVHIELTADEDNLRSRIFDFLKITWAGAMLPTWIETRLARVHHASAWEGSHRIFHFKVLPNFSAERFVALSIGQGLLESINVVHGASRVK